MIVRFGPLLNNYICTNEFNSSVNVQLEAVESKGEIDLNSDLLFYILLPPIIFNAGYSVDQVNEYLNFSYMVNDSTIPER